MPDSSETSQTVIEACLTTRSWLSGVTSSVLKIYPEISEEEFATAIMAEIKANSNLFPEGWYAPPPGGVAALFGDSDSFERLKFDTLRREKYWPRKEQTLTQRSAGLVYASPIDKSTGAIGDFGMTIYRGEDKAVHAHLSDCLTALERSSECAEEGMEFRELHDLSQKVFMDSGLHNARTITWTDAVGTNLGHTVPWSYEEPTDDERAILNAAEADARIDLISKKRLFINRLETFKIPKNIAFTLEARLENTSDPVLPNSFFHLVIAFKNGVRTVSSNFNEVFATLGMDSYIKSKF
jgi:hypothetical protein